MATTLKGSLPSRSGSIQSSDKGFTYNRTIEYVVVSDSKTESEWTVLTTTGLPDVFLTAVDGLRCVNKEAKQDAKSPYKWIVSCQFTADTTGQDTSNNNPDPETWIPLWTGAIETYDEVLMEDFSSPPKPYVNSAKDKFPEALIAKKPIIVHEFVQYEPFSLSAQTISARNDSVNSTIFKGFAAQTLKLNVQAYTRGYYFNKAVTKISYRVSYKQSKWVNRPLDMGYSYMLSGKKVVSPYIVALNSDGTKKADTADPVVNTEFKAHPQLDFSTFIR